MTDTPNRAKSWYDKKKNDQEWRKARSLRARDWRDANRDHIKDYARKYYLKRRSVAQHSSASPPV